jgi:uncharacterized protein (UPF0332 family)
MRAQSATVVGFELYEATAHSTYFAAFHAAQALRFQRTERAFKTHGGVRSEFVRIIRDDAFSPENRAFLGRGYKLKTIADYGRGLARTIDRGFMRSD